MRSVGHVARVGEEKGVYRVLVGRPDGKRRPVRPRRRRKDNIKMDLQEVGLKSTYWIGLAQDRNRWWALVSAVTFGFHKMGRICCLAEELLASLEVLCYMELARHGFVTSSTPTRFDSREHYGGRTLCNWNQKYTSAFISIFTQSLYIRPIDYDDFRYYALPLRHN